MRLKLLAYIRDGAVDYVVDGLEYGPEPIEMGLISISSITRSGSVATVTTASAHSYKTGDVIQIQGCVETEYNGEFTITVTTSTAFTFAVTGTPATPAAASNKNASYVDKFYPKNGYLSYPDRNCYQVDLLCAEDPKLITSITRSGSTATVTTPVNHGLLTSDEVWINGADQDNFNGNFIVTVTGATTFTIAVENTGATTATGVIQYRIEEWRFCRRYTLKKSSKMNVSYVAVRAVPVPLTGSIVDIGALVDGNPETAKPNRFMASEPLSPLSNTAAKVYYTDQKVRGFGVNVVAPSSGQFGFYPLIVFCDKMRYLYEVDTTGDGFLSRRQIISTSRGLVSAQAKCNADTMVVAVTDSGIDLVSGPNARTISDPVWDELKADAASITMAYHESGDLKELWVCGNSKMFVYSVTHGVWSRLERPRLWITGRQNKVWGITEGSNYQIGFDWYFELGSAPGADEIVLIDETSTQHESRSIVVEVLWQPLNFGASEHLKRVYRLFALTNFVKTSTSLRTTVPDVIITMGPIDIVSITRSGTVATVTTDKPHNRVTGNTVTIAGAVQTQYNGAKAITTLSATEFSYTVSGSPTTPATGTMEMQTAEEPLFMNADGHSSRGPAGAVYSLQPRLVAAGLPNTYVQGLDVEFELRRTHVRR